MTRRVVITGVGSITALGEDTETLWNNLLKGKSGITRLENIDVSQIPVKIGGEIKNFDATKKFPPNKVKRMDRFVQFAMWASEEAVRDSGINFDEEDRRRIGVIIASGMGGIIIWEKEHIKFLERGPSRVSPFLIPMMIPDMASGQVSIEYKLHGPNYCTTSACASAGHAIGNGFRLIKHGYADVMIVGGTESALTTFSIAGFANMRALSRRNDEPERASRPFDRDRDGFVMAEGCGILVIEEMEHALKRGARIYAEIAGYGATGDAYHITAPEPEGTAPADAMRMALEEAGMGIEDIDYINAHGTSTKLNDSMETKAIKKVFGDRAYDLKINSTKSMIGHLLGAAAGVESIVTALSIYHGKLHKTLNLENPDPECDLNYLPDGPVDYDVKGALSLSLGFGGHNIALAFRKYI